MLKPFALFKYIGIMPAYTKISTRNFVAGTFRDSMRENLVSPNPLVVRWPTVDMMV